MSIQQLNSQYFQVAGSPQKSLILKLSGAVLVFFKSQRCNDCLAFFPAFQQISVSEPRLVFAAVDVDLSRDIVQMSVGTTTEVIRVPQIILYIQGRPHARFRGQDKTKVALQSFIQEALKGVNLQQGPPQQNQYPQQPPQNQYPQQPPQNQYPPPRGNAFVQPQQNMYGGPSYPQNQVYMPEVNPSRQAGQIAGYGQGPAQAHPSMQQQCDPSKEDCLQIPDQIIPHNQPWESDYKQLTGVI